jgi:hypothetical protein
MREAPGAPHEHNHGALTHSHVYAFEDEERDYDKEAHIHGHAAPSESPAWVGATMRETRTARRGATVTDPQKWSAR